MENIIKALKALSGMSDESISLLLQNSRPVTFRKRDIITSSLKRDSFSTSWKKVLPAPTA